jgi:hypothetical protein
MNQRFAATSLQARGIGYAQFGGFNDPTKINKAGVQEG